MMDYTASICHVDINATDITINKNSSGDEMANVNFFTTTSPHGTRIQNIKKRTYFL